MITKTNPETKLTKTMKKLLILILLLTAFGLNAQERDKWSHSDTIISGTDSLYVDTLYSKYQFAVLTVRDTGSTFTDSLQIEVLDMNYKTWSPVSVLDLSDGILYDYCVAGAGLIRRFLIYDPNIYIFRVRLINTQYVAGRTTFISVMAKNY